MSDLLVSSQAVGKVRSKKAPIISRTRKALQVLQVSANDQNILVASPNMAPKKEQKVLKSSGKTFKISEDNDCGDNGTFLRRSKRKNIMSQDQNEKGASKEEQVPSIVKNSKIKLTKASKVKKVPKVEKTKVKPALLNQSNLDSYISIGSKSSESCLSSEKGTSNEGSMLSEIKEECTIVHPEEPSMCVTKSTSEEADMLTSDVPTLLYWKLLAEERRKALEVTLYENAQLKDVLEVMEAEIGQLKGTLKEAEKVLEIVNASLG